MPYRNPVDAANDLAEGRVQVYTSALAIVRPQIEAGKIKLLAVTNAVRAPTEPDVPTVAEAGYPALTRRRPGRPVRAARHAARAARADHRRYPRGRRRHRRGPADHTGQLLNIGGPEEFAKSIDEQRATVAAIAKDLGIKPLQ